ncbi:sodium-dependent multivitamin transporter-like [Clavelina lepadiformis]
MEKQYFEVWDYVIFSVCLLSSLAIGIYHAFAGGQQTTTNEFLMADRRMNYAPVSLSLLVTIMSAITVLGVPSEVFQHGTSYGMFSFSYFIFIPIVAHGLVPVFYDMKITSVYEYLGRRFSRVVRLCATVAYMVMMITYMGVVLYTPALAINAVTDLNVWVSVVGLCVICTIYTGLGGLKAVIWTDVFQAIVMLLAQIVVIFIGSSKSGGFSTIFKLAAESGKLAPLNFNPSPLVAHTFWALTFGGTFLCMGIYGVNQTAVQRVISCKSKRHAQITVYLNFPLLQLVMVIACVLGLVMFAEYRCNNPLAYGAKSDQLLLYYVMNVLGDYPGIPGLFVACLFCASLSTISSCFSSLSTVALRDIIQPNINLSDRAATFLSKCLILFFGLLCFLMALVASQLDSVLKAALSILGIMGGPMLSLFILGMFCRYINSTGALSGFLVSSAIAFWIGFGGLAYRMGVPRMPSPPILDHSCAPLTNYTSTVTSAIVDQTTDADLLVPAVNTYYDGINIVYKLSYMWYSGMSVLVSFVVASFVSLVTGREEILDEEALHPLFRAGGYFGPKTNQPNKEELISLETKISTPGITT